MSTAQKIIKCMYNKSGHIEVEQVKLACKFLNQLGGVVALPTDTLYGIAARVDDSQALDRIYKIKGRDASKPLAVCLANVEQIEQVADIRNYNRKLFSSLLPGPITVVLKRSESLNKDLNPSIDTIGVRVPDHNFIMAVSAYVGPLALTSANRSGESNPITIDDFSELWDDLDCVFNTGSLKPYLKDTSAAAAFRLGSTVVDLSDSEKRVYKIIREGCAFNRTMNVLARFGYIRKQ